MSMLQSDVPNKLRLVLTDWRERALPMPLDDDDDDEEVRRRV